MTGICIHPDLDDLDQFSSQNFHREDWDPYQLTNGNILEIGQPHRKIIFDLNGGAEGWSGYATGFLYPDGKYLAKFNYVREAQLESESLAGHFVEHDDAIELKGVWYCKELKYGFFVWLKHENNDNDDVATQKVTPIKKKIRKLITQEINSETYPEILTSSLWERLEKRALKLEQKNVRPAFSAYNFLLDLKPEPESVNDLVIAISIAYSWMPTMLDIYASNQKEIALLLPKVRKLGRITSVEDFDRNISKIRMWLIDLTRLINHSIVGVSKTLHIFFPESIPILDSRVLITWNRTFSTKYQKAPYLKLPKTVPQTIERMVEVYLRYWRLMLCWQHNTGQKTIRPIEKSLYWIGKQ